MIYSRKLLSIPSKERTPKSEHQRTNTKIPHAKVLFFIKLYAKKNCLIKKIDC